jgi:hypothetical protein
MSARDRIVVMVISVVVLLGAAWILVVSPERKKASGLGGQVSTAQAALSTAEGQLSQARAAEAQYPAAYASMVTLGKAVPATQEVPSLIYELEHASNARRVEFASISSTTGSGSGAASSGTAASAAASTSGFSQLPFTFIFNGSFFDLEHLFGTVDGFAKRTANGTLEVDGRLLTIQAVKLSPATSTQGSSGGQLSGTISATAYVLPPGSPSSPAAGSSAAAPASSSAASGSSPTPPAVVTP